LIEAVNVYTNPADHPKLDLFVNDDWNVERPFINQPMLKIKVMKAKTVSGAFSTLESFENKLVLSYPPKLHKLAEIEFMLKAVSYVSRHICGTKENGWNAAHVDSFQMHEIIYMYVMLHYAATVVGDTALLERLFLLRLSFIQNNFDEIRCQVLPPYGIPEVLQRYMSSDPVLMHQCLKIDNQNICIHDSISRDVVRWWSSIRPRTLNDHFVSGRHPFDFDFIHMQSHRLFGRKKAMERWFRLQRVARLLQTICMTLVDVYNEVTYRPGRAGYCATEEDWCARLEHVNIE
jgi:hypothetical protein